MSRERLGGFSSNLELKVPHPEEICIENFVCFYSGSLELQMRENGVFFTPVKYTLVCRTLKFSWFLGPHDTLPCVLIGRYTLFSEVSWLIDWLTLWINQLMLLIIIIALTSFQVILQLNANVLFCIKVPIYQTSLLVLTITFTMELFNKRIHFNYCCHFILSCTFDVGLPAIIMNKYTVATIM